MVMLVVDAGAAVGGPVAGTLTRNIVPPKIWKIFPKTIYSGWGFLFFNAGGFQII